jgi:hypothetical protein
MNCGGDFGPGIDGILVRDARAIRAASRLFLGILVRQDDDTYASCRCCIDE